MMKKLTGLLGGTGMLLLAAQASAVVIQDNYYGHNKFGSYWNRDVIADAGDHSYDISNMDVSVTGGVMNVRINTNFAETGANGDRYGVRYGDLFIGTDGWHPFGSAPYSGDDATHTGTDWNFVFDTSADTLYGGNFSKRTSDYFFGNTNYIYRNNQIVQRDSGGIAFAGSSTDLSHAGNGGYIQYNILLSSLGIKDSSQVALRWGMTCANDVIEGSYNVPEPGALMLLGLGLVGLGLTARKGRKETGSL